MTSPVTFGVRFKDPVTAEVVSHLSDVKRRSGDTIIFTTRDMAEASRFIEAISAIRMVIGFERDFYSLFSNFYPEAKPKDLLFASHPADPLASLRMTVLFVPGKS